MFFLSANFHQKIKRNLLENIILLSPIVGILASCPPSWSQSIVPAGDNTATIVNQNGDRLVIDGGTLSEQNLFHSFQEFGLSNNEIATFLSNPTIQNILGRVVGGNPSIIDGLLQVTGGDSNLFLMNPAGIVIGENGRLDLSGSFSGTTATGIEFEGGRFNAIGENNYTDLTGNPTAFSFGLNQPSSIINAGNLEVEEGQSISLIGGDVVNTGTLKAPGGNISIVAVPGTSRVQVSQTGWIISLEIDASLLLEETSPAIAPWELAKLLTEGTLDGDTGLEIDENGAVKLSQSGVEIPTGGGTVIASGGLDVANTTTTGTGGEIAILGETVGLVGAEIDASGDGDGGRILVGGDYKGQGTVPNAETTYVSQDSVIRADAETSGDGGEIIVWADGTTAFNGEISAEGGELIGDGGFVEVSGKETLLYRGDVSTSATNGKTGNLLLDPEDIRIVNGTGGSDDSQLDASSTSSLGEILSGDGGSNSFTISKNKLEGLPASTSVLLEASNNITIDNLSDGKLTFQPGSNGVGSITFNAVGGNFQMDSSDTIIANQRNIKITAGNDITLGSINTANGTNGGTITLDAVNTVQTQSLDAGSGGVSITAGDIRLGAVTTTGAGPITLNASNVVQTQSLNAGSGGITVTAGSTLTSPPNLDIGGVATGDSITLKAPNTTAQAGSLNAGGGGVNVMARDIILGTVTTTSKGSITLDADNTVQTIIKLDADKGSGAINITANEIDFKGGADSVISNQPIILKTKTDNRDINIGNMTPPPSTALNLDTTDIAALGNRDIKISSASNTGIVNLMSVSQIASTSKTFMIEGGSELIGPDINILWEITDAQEGTISPISPISPISLVNPISFKSIEKITGGTGNDTFMFANDASITTIHDKDGINDRLDYSAYTDPLSVDLKSLEAVGIEEITGSTNSTLTAFSGANTWTIDGLNSGMVKNTTTPQSIIFKDFQTITGNSGIDTFDINTGGSVTTINGGADSDIFNINDGSATTINGNGGDDQFNINGGIVSVINGGADSDIFNINSSGNVTTINGNGGEDKFNINGGSVSVINGGTDNDTLYGDNTRTTWNITGANLGDVNGTNSFIDIENLVGGMKDDTFMFDDGASVVSIIDMDGTNDRLDYSAYMRSFSVPLESLKADGIETIIGSKNSGVNSELIGFNAVNTWTINGSSPGTVTGTGGMPSIEFQDFQTITGNAQDDTFNVSSGGSVDTINGNDGVDTFTISSGGSVDTINGNNGDDEFNVSSSNVTTINGGLGVDIFTISSGGSVDTINGNNGDDEFNVSSSNVTTINGDDGVDIFTISSGSSVDTINGNDGGDEFNVSSSNVTTINGDAGVDIFTISSGSSVDTINGNDGDDKFNVSSSNVTTINGNNGDDAFNVSSSNVATINGGPGDNTLYSGDTRNTWNITSTNSGDVDFDNVYKVSSFNNINNLVGGTGEDTFKFKNNVDIYVINIKGGSSTSSIDDILDYSYYTTSLDVSLDDLPAMGIEKIMGSNKNDGSSTLTAFSGENRWTIDALNSGTVANITGSIDIDFEDFQNITGNSGVDTFNLIEPATLDGTLDGGLGSDELNFTGYSTPVTLNLESDSVVRSSDRTPIVNFSNIQTFTGSGSGDTIIGSNNETLWSVNVSDINITTTISGITTQSNTSIKNFENLVGGNANDTFIINGGSLKSIDGGGGINSLSGANTINTWDITGSNDGALNRGSSGNRVDIFSDIQDLIGGNVDDRFEFGSSVVLGSNIDGSSGSLTLNGTDNILTSGSITNLGNVNITAVNNVQTNNISASGDLDVMGDRITISGNITNSNNTTLRATNDIETQNISASGDLDITGDRIEILGDITNADRTTLTAANDIETRNISASNSVSINANNDIETQDISASGNSLILNSTNGAITTSNLTTDNNASISLTANNDLIQTNDISASGDLGITGDRIEILGNITNSNNTTLEAANDIETRNISASGNSLRLNSTNGAITTNNLTTNNNASISLTASNNEVKTNEISASGDLDVMGDRITISGNITNSGSTTLEANNDIQTNGTINNAGNLNVMGDRIKILGNITSADRTTLTATNDIETQNISASNNVSITANNNIQTGNISAPGESLTLRSNNGTIDTENLNTASQSSGGDISLNAGNSIETGQINSSGATGNGGDVTLKSGDDNPESQNNIEVAFIDAQGGTSGVGGSVEIEAGLFFRATEVSGAPTLEFSISTQGGAGDGSISISHNGPLERQLFTVGSSTSSTEVTTPNPINGTVGRIISRSNNEIVPVRFFPGSYKQDNIEIKTITPPNDLISPTAQPLPDATDSETLAEIILQELEKVISEEFTNYYGRAKVETKSLSTIQSELRQVQNQTGDEVIPAAIYPFFLKAGIDAEQLEQAVNNPENASGEQSFDTNTQWQFSSGQSGSLYSKIIPYISQAENDSDELALMVVTAQGQPILKSTGIEFKQVKANVSDLHSQIDTLETNSRSESEWEKKANQIYQYIVAPIVNNLQSQNVNNLLFIMDAKLRLLPIATLLDNKNEPLIKTYSMSLVPSMSLINTQYKSIQNEPFLVMGTGDFSDADPEENLDNLESVGIEMKFIDENWNGNIQFDPDKKFTIDRLQKALKVEGSFHLLHLATHARFKSGEPEKSYIHFSGNERLLLNEIEDVLGSLEQVDLLTLSACQTALGDRDAELGFAGFAYQTGAKSILASLRDVPDLGTTVLMAQFYENLNIFPTKAEALKEAQLAMMEGKLKINKDDQIQLSNSDAVIDLSDWQGSKENVDFSTPENWGGFTIVGSPW